MKILENNIYNMDCIDGMKLIEDNSIDLIVTSPPYNVGIDYDSWDDGKPWEEYLDWCKEWLSECYRVLKDDGRICINHYLCFDTRFSDRTEFPLFDFRNIMTDIGYTVHKIALWDDITCKKFTAWGSWMSPSAPNIMTPYEGILIAYKKQWKKDGSGRNVTLDKETFMEGVSGIWHIGTTQSITKCCFPERLPEICIQLLSFEDDLVLDPFSGSGTTAFVAKKLHRRYIGFEISKNYYEASLARMIGAVSLPIEQKEDDKVIKKFDFLVDK